MPMARQPRRTDSTKRCATSSGGCTSGAIASKNGFTKKLWKSFSFQYVSRHTGFAGAFTSESSHGA
jgi:hypothetical protein